MKRLFVAIVFILSLFNVFCEEEWEAVPDSEIFEELNSHNIEENKNILSPERKDMIVLQEDIYLVNDTNIPSLETGKGVHLYIRKKSGINSVMLVETTKDPAGKEANYAYRAKEYNPVNGDEIRYLNGKVLNSQYSRYSLISSTVVKQYPFDECFHIFIPLEIIYGYPWSRNGSVKIGKGTFVNIRTFEKPYGDYTGAFMDNPFMFDLEKVLENIVEPEVLDNYVLTDDYNSVAALKFAEIAKEGNGLITYSKGPETITQDLIQALSTMNPEEKADVIFAIDTTGSMKDDMDTLRNEWVPQLIKQLKGFKDIRLGLLFYRDYTDGYNYKGLPVKIFDFTSSTDKFTKNLNTVVIKGKEGGDVPEAVYEALYSSMSFYNWRSDSQKKIILIGDAEPHPKPRGIKKISQEMVIKMAEEKNIILDCIIVPDDKKEARER